MSSVPLYLPHRRPCLFWFRADPSTPLYEAHPAALKKNIRKITFTHRCRYTKLDELLTIIGIVGADENLKSRSIDRSLRRSIDGLSDVIVHARICRFDLKKMISYFTFSLWRKWDTKTHLEHEKFYSQSNPAKNDRSVARPINQSTERSIHQ